MIKVKNKEFNTDITTILNDLKLELAKSGLTYFKTIKNTNDYVMTQCPYHKNGNEKKPSCGFRKDSGYMHCFTCGEKHSLDEVIKYLMKEDGLEWLSNNYSNMEYVNDRKVDLNFKDKKDKIDISYIDSSEIAKYRKFHPYMFERKLTKDVIRKYDIGYDEDTDTITFPNKDEHGNILFITRRKIAYKSFIIPKGVEKVIYGLYELKRDFPDTKSVIICESIINALTCVSYGKPAIALNGTGSRGQIEKLAKLPYRKYYIGLDPDEAGNKGSDRIINALKNKKMLTRLNIPEGKDINDLTKEEFDKLFQGGII